MTKEDALRILSTSGVIAPLTVTTVDAALKAARELQAAQVQAIAVNVTHPEAIAVIEQLAAADSSNLAIGASEVLDDDTARACLVAGASFVVSPGLESETIQAVRNADAVVIAGALTPTEIMAAWTAGADLIRVFPCRALGGPAYIRALKGPFPKLPLVATEVTPETAAAYLEAGAEALEPALNLDGTLAPTMATNLISIVRAQRKL